MSLWPVLRRPLQSLRRFGRYREWVTSSNLFKAEMTRIVPDGADTFRIGLHSVGLASFNQLRSYLQMVIS